MKVLLTGGAGFIGRPTAGALSRAGAEVSVFDWALDVRDDITALDRVCAVMQGCDAVVHLAAKVGLGVDLDDMDDYVRNNDLGTAIVLRAAATGGVRRLVYASSMVVYGEGAYECPRHGPIAPPPRTPEDLSAGRFDPRCPACGDDLIPRLVPESAPFDPRNTYAATKVHGRASRRLLGPAKPARRSPPCGSTMSTVPVCPSTPRMRAWPRSFVPG